MTQSEVSLLEVKSLSGGILFSNIRTTEGYTPPLKRLKLLIFFATRWYNWYTFIQIFNSFKWHNSLIFFS